MNNMMLAAAEVGEQLAPTINSIAEAVKMQLSGLEV